MQIEWSEILKQHEDERMPCQVYTRVMGYHRPVESFNLGKKGEHKERKQFEETPQGQGAVNENTCSR